MFLYSWFHARVVFCVKYMSYFLLWIATFNLKVLHIINEKWSILQKCHEFVHYEGRINKILTLRAFHLNFAAYYKKYSFVSVFTSYLFWNHFNEIGKDYHSIKNKICLGISQFISKLKILYFTSFVEYFQLNSILQSNAAFQVKYSNIGFR